MSSLPPRILQYLQDQLFGRARPFCFLVDGSYAHKQSWGDGRWCGLDGIEPGSDMLEHAPYLLGTLGTEVLLLEHVKGANGVDCQLHSIPDEAGHYIVLLDSRQEHDARHVQQQSVNELRLVHAQQIKMIERQRELISELVETRAELDHHRRDAERISANKGRFIAMMSHEFRTPLASIINYADLAAEKDASGNTVEKSIEAISRSARHLNSLVEAVLDDARLDAGQLELQERSFDLYELLTDLAAMMAPLAAEKGLAYATQVDPDVPRRIRADDVRLRQILINLLGNAVKYTQDGDVQLIVSYHDGRLVATVSDTGPGISPDEQERVFQAFERGSRTDARGAGLGLTITLRLAKLMGGEISLDSTPGEGCTVSLHIPAFEAVGDAGSTSDALPTPGVDTVATKPLSILICDDDEDMVALMEHYLHRSGYGLVATSDSSEAISKVLKFDPDLVLMDCNVPGISGVDAARLLRQQGYDKPIVALTASQLSRSEREVFTEYFRKPTDMQQLLGVIKALTH